MLFYELCHRAKSMRITVVVHNGANKTYYPDELHCPVKELDYTGRKWLTKSTVKFLLNYYVTSIEPTALNYMTVRLVANDAHN